MKSITFVHAFVFSGKEEKNPSLFPMHIFIKQNAFIQTVDGSEMCLKASWTGLNRTADLFTEKLVFK